MFFFVLALVISMIGIADAQNKKKSKNKTNSLNESSLLANGGEQIYVNKFFELIINNPVEFESVMLVKGIVEKQKSGDVADVIQSATYAYLLDEHYADKISCTRSQESVNELTKEKGAAWFASEPSRQFLRKLHTVAIQQKKDSLAIEIKALTDDYFNRSVPLLTSLYKKHPSRKYCN